MSQAMLRLHATFAAMRCPASFYFAYFWFSPHPVAREASA